MIIHIVHGYAHRILNNGVVESAPMTTIDKESKTENASDPNFFRYGIAFGEWLPRTPESMNHTGGDMALIQETLERYANLFPADYRLPNVTEAKQDKPAANEPR